MQTSRRYRTIKGVSTGTPHCNVPARTENVTQTVYQEVCGSALHLNAQAQESQPRRCLANANVR